MNPALLCAFKISYSFSESFQWPLVYARDTSSVLTSVADGDYDPMRWIVFHCFFIFFYKSGLLISGFEPDFASPTVIRRSCMWFCELLNGSPQILGLAHILYLRLLLKSKPFFEIQGLVEFIFSHSSTAKGHPVHSRMLLKFGVGALCGPWKEIKGNFLLLKPRKGFMDL